MGHLEGGVYTVGREGRQGGKWRESKLVDAGLWSYRGMVPALSALQDIFLCHSSHPSVLLRLCIPLPVPS